MLDDPWLSRWLQLIHESSGSGSVLEIGCGHGADTAILTAAGLRVHAFDLSAVAVRIARIRVPSAKIELRDIRAPLPEGAEKFGTIVASLSLHYFAWAETADLIGRIRLALRPNGVLLCRFNSTDDHNFGASGHPEIEPNFYLVEGERKRFFDKGAVESLFAAGWNILSLEHFATRKYVKTKALWEVVLERRDA
jgi:SAM-dependent methyltransferase